MKRSCLVLAVTTLGVASGALRGQKSTAPHLSKHHSPALSTRLQAATRELHQLDKSDTIDVTSSSTIAHPSLVEMSTRNVDSAAATKHVAAVQMKSAQPVYHADKKEQKGYKVTPLPPPRFMSAGAKIVPSFSGSVNPYAQGSIYGRGYQDAMTPMTGTYAGNYGPASGGPMGTQGYGSFPQQVDPRGFGGTHNFSTPYSNFFGSFSGKGVSSEGFKYQVPYSNIHPMAPYTGNPFTAQYGPGGPYYQQGQQNVAGGSEAKIPSFQNYTQFGPRTFGPYGTMNQPGGGSVVPVGRHGCGVCGGRPS